MILRNDKGIHILVVAQLVCSEANLLFLCIYKRRCISLFTTFCKTASFFLFSHETKKYSISSCSTQNHTLCRTILDYYYYYVQCTHYPIGETTTVHDVTSLDRKANKVTGNTLFALFDANNVNKSNIFKC